MPTAPLTSRGRITLPKEIRTRLSLKPGDLVDFEIDSSGKVRLRAVGAGIGALRGILHRAGRGTISLVDMEAAIHRRGRPRSKS